MQQLLNNYRNMFLVRGLAAIIFGVLTLVWPKLSLLVLVVMFGIFAVIGGITAVAAAFQNRHEEGWGLLLFEGILWTLAGVVALVWPGITAYAFLFLIAAWAIITGITELVAPLAFPMSGGRAVLMVLAGLASIVFGVLIAAQPVAGLLTVVWLIGIYADPTRLDFQRTWWFIVVHSLISTLPLPSVQRLPAATGGGHLSHV